MTYGVEVRRGRAVDGEMLFSTNVTFVNVDRTGRKREI